jgi:cell division protein FtsQ
MQRHKTKNMRNYRKMFSKRTARRKMNLTDIFRFFLKCTLVSLGIASLALISVLLYKEIIKSSYFQVKNIQVEGCERYKPAQILYMAGINPRVNLLSLNLKSICQRLEDSPWIEVAKIKRIFPDKLEISIIERKPAALINLSQLYLVDNKGTIFKKVEREDGLAFPVLTGITWQDLMNRQETYEPLIAQALHLMSLFEEEGVSFPAISEINLDATFGLTVFTTRSATQIEMGFSPFQEKCTRLYTILDDLEQKDLIPQVINLNYRHKAFIKIKPQYEKVKSTKKGGEKQWEKMGI